MTDDDMDDMFNWDYPLTAKAQTSRHLWAQWGMSFGAGFLAVVVAAYAFGVA